MYEQSSLPSDDKMTEELILSEELNYVNVR